MKKFLLAIGFLVVANVAKATPVYVALEKLVAAAGTEERLSATNVYTSRVVIKARTNNGGDVYIGGAGVSSTTGFHLDANQELILGDLGREGSNEAINLKDIWIDAGTNGDGVRIIYVQGRYKSGEPAVQ